MIPIATLLLAAASATGVHVDPAPADATVRPLPMHVGGRVERRGDELLRQWPGTYFETAFRGTAAAFRVGPGDVTLHVLVDGMPVATLVKPAPGLFRVAGVSAGTHRLRIEVASESQAAPTGFGGFAAPAGTTAAALPNRHRQIEFIGDSHTVGYGNTSPRQQCTQDEVWATTDTSRAFGPLLAKRHDADYAINAISGRGVVRNYDGFAAPTMPEAYPYALFDAKAPASQPDWHPQVIVIALGTNDFTTPLHAGERWPTRATLHADYEQRYVDLVTGLRRQHPQAYFVLWATGLADGEIEAEVSRVADRLHAAGERRLSYVPIDTLSFSACHGHPSTADDRAIADALDKAITDHVPGWKR